MTGVSTSSSIQMKLLGGPATFGVLLTTTAFGKAQPPQAVIGPTIRRVVRTVVKPA
jgi:hypothetical protein